MTWPGTDWTVYVRPDGFTVITIEGARWTLRTEDARSFFLTGLRATQAGGWLRSLLTRIAMRRR